MPEQLPEGANLRLECHASKQEIPKGELMQRSARGWCVFSRPASLIQHIDSQQGQS